MKRFPVIPALVAAALVAGVWAAPAAAQDAPELMAVGEAAPDVELVGATRHGVLRDPVHLGDYRGETVVLAFFFRARTRG